MALFRERVAGTAEGSVDLASVTAALGLPAEAEGNRGFVVRRKADAETGYDLADIETLVSSAPNVTVGTNQPASAQGAEGDVHFRRGLTSTFDGRTVDVVSVLEKGTSQWITRFTLVAWANTTPGLLLPNPTGDVADGSKVVALNAAATAYVLATVGGQQNPGDGSMDGVVDTITLALSARRELELILGRTEGLQTLEGVVDLSSLLTDLLGEPHDTLIAELDSQANLQFGTAKLVTSTGVDPSGTDEIEIRVVDGTTTHNFVALAHEWLANDDVSVGDTLVADSAVLVTLPGAGTIFVGRDANNDVLVQFGTFAATEATFDVEVRTRRYANGMLDKRIAETGARHFLCAQVRSATEPDAPERMRYDGRVLSQSVESGLTYSQAGEAVPPGSDKLWFLFGEAVYNPLSGQWDVQDSWIVVDSTDTTLTVNYGPNWTGPWGTDAYNAALDRFARLRQPNGEFLVRQLGNDAAALRREWRLFAELAIDGSGVPYTAQTFFDLYPSDFTLFRAEYVYENRADDVVAFILPASSIRAVGSDRGQSGLGGHTWRAFFSLTTAGAFVVSQQNPAGSSTAQSFRLNFESGETDGSFPVKSLRAWYVGSTSTLARGKLRCWVM